MKAKAERRTAARLIFDSWLSILAAAISILIEESHQSAKCGGNGGNINEMAIFFNMSA